MVVGQHNEEILNDAIFVMIGYLPDTTLLKQLGVEIRDSSLAPIHDASTMQTNIAGVYVAGSVAAGKHSNKIFIENGRMHGRSIYRVCPPFSLIFGASFVSFSGLLSEEHIT